ncbi:MAG: tape measure protein [Burkholderiales bacterium]|nr:tape measure protein [Burkholderiales bacterium]
MTEPKIKYDLEAAVKGEAEAEELAKALRDVGDVLEGDLQSSARNAAAALDTLAGKQRAIESFGTLKRESEGLSAALQQATSTVDRLANELPQAAANTQILADAERAAATAVQTSVQDLDRKKAALKSLQTDTTAVNKRTDEYRQTVTALKDGIKALNADIKLQQSGLRVTAQEAAKAQGAEAGLRKEYELAVGSAQKLSAEVGNKNRALEVSRQQLQGMGVSTTGLVQAERNLQGAVAEVRKEVAAMAPAYQQAAAASSAATRTQAQNQRTLRDGMTSISTQLQRIQQIATIAVGGNYFTGLIKDVADTADEFRNLEARVKLATGEGGGFAESFKGVQQVALDTHSALEGTATLFARITKAGEEAGMASLAAQQQALQLTQTINQATQLSGGSAESARAALTQLIQGFQSGVLRGEEFNSVMEQAPRLAQALANGLGVTTGELRNLAQQGALTTDVVIKALRGQADVVAGEFQKLPPTVGRALQDLSTQWTLYVGQADKGLLSSANVAKVINALAGNLDMVVGSLTAAGKAWAAIKVAGLVADFTRWATSTLTATKAMEANTVAAAANTAAQRANSAAQAENAVAQRANTAASVANTAARAGNAKAWADVGVFTRAAAGAQAAATTAVVQNTAALAGNAAQAAKAGIVWRAASSLVGPWGIAVAALTPEILGLGRALGEQLASWTSWGKMLRENEAQLRTQEEAIKAQAEQMARGNQLFAEARDRQFELSKAAMGLVAEFDKLRKEGTATAQAIEKIGKDFDLASIPGIRDASAVLDKLAADGKISADQFEQAWKTALSGQDLAQFEVMARAAFAGSAREAERLQQVLDASVREAVRRTGLDFDLLKGGISAASRSAINDVEAIVQGMDRLKQQGVDTGLVLGQSLERAIRTADSQAALDALRSRVEDLKGSLGERVTSGLLEQISRQSDDLRLRMDRLRAGIQSTAEAFSFFGLKGQAELQRTARESAEAYEVLRSSGTATAEQLRSAFVRVAQEAIAANKGIAPAWLATEAAIRDVKITTDELGQATVEAIDKGVDRLGRLEHGWRRIGETVAATAAQVEAFQAMQDRYARPDGASIVGATRDERLSGQNAVDNTLLYDVIAKMREGKLGADDTGDVEAVLAALAQNESVFRDLDRSNPGGISTQGLQSRNEMQVVAELLKQFISAQGRTNKTVKVDLRSNGGTSSFNTDDAGAEVVINALKQAKSNAGA